MVRQMLARGAAALGIVAACCVGLVVNAGTSQALGIPDWITTGTMCDTSTWKGGFENLPPESLALVGTLPVTMEATAPALSAAGTAAAGYGAAAMTAFFLQGCVYTGAAREFVIPWLTGKVDSPSTAMEARGQETCADYPVGQCDSIKYFGSLDWVGTPTGDAFTVKASGSDAASQGRDPYVSIGYDCWTGYHDGYAFPVDNGVSQTFGPLGGCATMGGFKKIHVTGTHGSSWYEAGTWNPVQWGNTLTIDNIPSIGAPQTAQSVEIRTTCRRPDGSTYDITKVTLSPIADGDTDGVAASTCNAGDVPTQVAGSINGAPTWKLPLQTPLTPTDQRRYPLCSGNACVYSVKIDGQTCVIGDPECANWTLIRRTTPDRVTCFYGAYTVSCDLLKWMERNYESTPTRVTKTNVDGDPDTKTTPNSNPLPNPGDPVVDPGPPVLTEPPSVPCLNGSVFCVPKLDPETPEVQRQECWPSGWGAVNPANWVLQPTKCALKWAFVPGPAALTEFTDGVKADLGTTGITDVSGAVGDVFSSLPEGGSGCQGPGFTWPQTGVTYHPLDACAGPMATAAAASYALATIVIVVSGGFAILRIVAAGLGYNVSLGSGGGGGES